MTRIELAGYPLVGIRAANPSPFSLSGTNTWIVSRDPAWVVDPGPLLDEHIQAVVAEIELRGGLGGIALTHDHVDHSEAVPALRARFPEARFGAARGDVGEPLVTEARSGRWRRSRRRDMRPTIRLRHHRRGYDR